MGKHKSIGLVLLLLFVCYIGGESWNLVNKEPYVSQQWDWFFGADKKISSLWVVKDFSEEIVHIILAILLIIAFWKWDVLVLKIATVAYLTYRIFDLGMWLWDYKTSDNYKWVYYLAFAVELIIWTWIGIKSFIAKNKKARL